MEEKKTLKTRNFTTVWAAERENDKDRMLAAFDLLSWETFLRGWHRCFLETRERETCGEVRPSLRTLQSLVYTGSVGCLFAVSAAHLAGLWGKVPILSLCPEATCGSVGCCTVELQRRGTWKSQRHFLSIFLFSQKRWRETMPSLSLDKQTLSKCRRCAFKIRGQPVKILTVRWFYTRLACLTSTQPFLNVRGGRLGKRSSRVVTNCY